ncbi:MAG: NAD(P)H-quinone oxidoreductase [Ferrimicrobium sp.]
MHAIHGANSTISLVERPTPTPRDEELLVQVAGAGINAADILQASGHYPPPPGTDPELLGLEFAGIVVACGSSASRYRVGDRVMGITTGAAQSQYLTIPATACVPVPQEMDLVHAGGMPETFFTAFDALVLQANLSAGDRLAIHGATGGVGTAAIQIGRYLGATITAVARTHQRDSELGALGAHQVVTPEEFPASGHYDVILELVGAKNLTDNLSALNQLGRIVVIGVGAGAKTTVDLRAIMGKRAQILGSTLRARSWVEKAVLADAVEHHLLPAFRDGRLRVVVDRTLAMSECKEAYAYFAAPGKMGKVILSIGT